MEQLGSFAPFLQSTLENRDFQSDTKEDADGDPYVPECSSPQIIVPPTDAETPAVYTASHDAAPLTSWWSTIVAQGSSLVETYRPDVSGFVQAVTQEADTILQRTFPTTAPPPKDNTANSPESSAPSSSDHQPSSSVLSQLGSTLGKVSEKAWAFIQEDEATGPEEVEELDLLIGKLGDGWHWLLSEAMPSLGHVGPESLRSYFLSLNQPIHIAVRCVTWSSFTALLYLVL